MVGGRGACMYLRKYIRCPWFHYYLAMNADGRILGTITAVTVEVEMRG